MKAFIFLPLLLLMAGGQMLMAAELPRIISLNMCADGLLLSIAAPEQIEAVAALSHDEAISPHAQAAKSYPAHSGRLEDLAHSTADIVIISPYSAAPKRAMIERLGKKSISIGAAQSLANVTAEALALGKAIGREAQARLWISSFTQKLADYENIITMAEQRPRLIAYQRRGLAAGEGHLLDDIITRAGFENIAKVTFLAPLSLEQVIAAEPDYLLLDRPHDTPNTSASNQSGRGQDALNHPAIAHIPALYLPAPLSVCAGPSSLAAIEYLLAQR